MDGGVRGTNQGFGAADHAGGAPTLKEEVDSLRRGHTGLEKRVQALERRAVSPAASRQSWSGSTASTSSTWT
eukprot:2056478-Lingulodinium_polyedra.AAC.1